MPQLYIDKHGHVHGKGERIDFDDVCALHIRRAILPFTRFLIALAFVWICLDMFGCVLMILVDENWLSSIV